MIRADLLVLPSNTTPRDRYLVGMLAPTGQELSPDLLEELWVEGEDEEQPDMTAGAAKGLFPSSLGLSFCLPDPVPQKVHVEVSWGQYFRDVWRP